MLVKRSMLVIRQPEEEQEKIYLECVLECAAKRGIECGIIQKDFSIKILEKYKLDLNKGDYVMFYGKKPYTVMELGKRLKEMGYKTLFIDRLTIALLKTLEKIFEN